MSHLVNQVGQVLGPCDVCMAFDKAPRVPIAGAATVSAFNGKVQADLLLLDDLIVAHAMLPSSPGAIRKSPGNLGRFLCGMAGDLRSPEVHPDGRRWREEEWNMDGFLFGASN